MSVDTIEGIKTLPGQNHWALVSTTSNFMIEGTVLSGNEVVYQTLSGGLASLPSDSREIAPLSVSGTATASGIYTHYFQMERKSQNQPEGLNIRAKVECYTTDTRTGQDVLATTTYHDFKWYEGVDLPDGTWWLVKGFTKRFSCQDIPSSDPK